MEAAAAAVAAATTLAMGDAPVAKQDPLLALARALVRHVKVRAKTREETVNASVYVVVYFFRTGSNGGVRVRRKRSGWSSELRRE